MEAATAALHAACARADERGVLRALDAGADVNALDEDGRSVLWLALLGHACVLLLFHYSDYFLMGSGL